MKKYPIAVAVLFSIVFAGSLCLAVDDTQKQNPELTGKIENGIRVIEVRASKYKFEPEPIVVKLGDKVRIIATTADVSHGFAISEFDVNLVIKPGETAIVEFTADKAGKFSEYCSVYCGPGHMDMRGKFIVLK